MTRPDPFTVAFGDLAEELFPPIGDDIARSATNVDDRDAFLMLAAAGAALRRLVSETAPPEALREHAALLHHAYRYWAAGRPLFTVDTPMLEHALRQGDDGPPGPAPAYVQLPERTVWAELAPDEPPQPLDGYFIARPDESHADLLAIFGLHPARAALSVVAVAGPWREGVLAAEAVRPDGAPLFSSLLTGGEAASLVSLATNAELLLLARRLGCHLAHAPGAD